MPRLSGNNFLAYLGVQAQTPANTFISGNPQQNQLPRDPTTNDYKGFNIGDYWVNSQPSVLPTPIYRLWWLAAKKQNIATWILIINGGGGTLVGLQPDVGAVVNPLLGIIELHNTDGNVITSNGNPPSNRLNVDFANTINVVNNINALLGGISANRNDATPTVITSNYNGNNTGGGFIQITKSRLGAAITSGDTVGSYVFYGFDGTNYVQSASMHSVSSGTIAANRVAGNLLFSTHPDSTSGGLGATLRMTISSAGNVTVSAPDSGDALTVTGTIVMPSTNSAGTEGILKLGVNRFLSALGTANTFLGNSSGNTSLTVVSAVQNTACGSGALDALTTGSSNTGIGANALTEVTTGINNSANGNATLAALSTGSSNAAFGSGALTSLATGSNNIAIGSGVGSAYTTTESSNILIGNVGVITENNIIRIGTSGGGAGQQNKCFIAGIRGITTDVNDAVAVLIDSAGQLGTTSSSIKYKQNVKDMGDESSILMKLRPVVFNYKHHPEVPAWGLIAEEVEKVFPQLVVYKNDEPETVKYHELVPLMLNEIQKLNNRIKILEGAV